MNTLDEIHIIQEVLEKALLHSPHLMLQTVRGLLNVVADASDAERKQTVILRAFACTTLRNNMTEEQFQ